MIQNPKILKGEDFLKENFKNKDFAITTFITNEYADMCLNWFENLKKIKLQDNCLIVCFDEKGYNVLKDKNIPCLLIESKIKMESIENFSTVKEKFELLSYIIKTLKKDVLYSDVDIIFFKNPIDRIKEISLNFKNSILINSNNPVKRFYLLLKSNIDTFDYFEWCKMNVPELTHHFSSLNFLYIKFIENQTINFWENLLQNFNFIYKSVQQEKCVFDKNGMAPFFGSTFQKLPVNEFPNFTYFLFDDIKQKIFENAYIVHYNYRDYVKMCYDFSLCFEFFNIEIKDFIMHSPFSQSEFNSNLVKDHKIKMMKLNNHWFI